MFGRTIVVGAIFASLSAVALAQTGRLEAGDARLESGEFFDLHEVEGRAGETLTITLASDAFDAYLIVLDPDDAPLAQVDDSDGLGLNARLELPIERGGSYAVVVTSAFADETGAYTLDVVRAPAAAAGANPLAPAAADPVAPAAAGPFEGTFDGDGVRMEVSADGEAVEGTLRVGDETYELAGRARGASLQGTFGRDGATFVFTATLDGETLALESGGGRYLLHRDREANDAGVPANPLATAAGGAAAPQPALPAPGVAAGAAADAPAAPPQPRIGARPGFVTGTVFDTRGRPLAGAGVQITGTTYTQGQRTQFETVTGADGTYAVRVPDGRYRAKAWVDVPYEGVLFSRILHPLSGNAHTEVDSVDGGTLDFQWRLAGLISPPGEDPSDYYGASIDLSYCGLPADAYCSFDYAAFPDGPIAPGGSTVRVTLTPVAPLLDGSQGDALTFEFEVMEQDPAYPYGGAPNAPAGYESGGGGRTVLGADWEYHSTYLHDVPVGVYEMRAVAFLPDGRSVPLKLGLDANDVEHEVVRVSFSPWEGFVGRSYSGGGIEELDVYVRD